MTSEIQVAVETLRSVAKAARTVKQNLGGPAVRIDLGKAAAEAFWASIDTVVQHLTAQQVKAPSHIPLGETIYTSPGEEVCFCYTRGQPGNVDASRLGEACRRAAEKPGGDYIDGGLSLLKELEAQGYGVFRFTKTGIPAAQEAEIRKPDGYAYRYRDAWGSDQTVVQFNDGRELNGSKPIEAVAYYLGDPPAKQPEAQAVAVVGPGGYPNWLISWLESPAYRTLPQGTKLYTLPTTQAVGVPRGMVESIVRNVAELPDRNSPEEWPEAMLVTADELASIVTAALAPAVGGEVWVNRCPYNHSRNVFCPSCVRTRPPGAVHGMPVQPEPISEGVQSRLEALRTTNWNLHSPQELADMVASTIEAALATQPGKEST